MGQFNCNIVKVFELADRLVLVTDAIGDRPDYTHGSCVDLRRPDGTIITTESWLERSSPWDENRPFALAIDAKFTKVDVPIGTSIVLSALPPVRSAKRAHEII